MSAVVSNLKLSITNFKISPDAIKRFSVLIIDNKNTKNSPILQYLLRALANSIDILSHYFCWKVKNFDGNNISNKNEAKEEIELKKKII